MSARSDREGPGPRGSRMMRKAEVLGIETRNVSSAYLLPVLSRGGPGTLYGGTSHTALTLGGGTSFYDPTPTTALSPKSITAVRTTRMLQSLGQRVIFSNDPYVNSAFESLLTTRISGVPADLAPDLTELISRKPPGGRLRPKGSKAAALKRAKRLVGATAAPAAAEVPFSDALRVCDLERDRSALPALLRAYVFNKPRVVIPRLEEYCEALSQLRPSPMLQAAALLIQAGYFFAAIKVVYNNFDALQATLTEMESLISQHMDKGDWETAAALWHWKDPDRELFLKQFKDLKIISYYLDVRKQLRALKEQGVVALARVEREMLLKVIQDFRTQLQEDFAAHQAQLMREAEERARAKARLEAQAQAAAEAAARRAEEAARVEARARAAAEAKAKREAEFREKAREMDRKREEVRRRAEEAKRLGRSRKEMRQPEYAAMAGAAAALFEGGAGGAAADDGPLVDPEPEPQPETSAVLQPETSEALRGPESRVAGGASDVAGFDPGAASRSSRSSRSASESQATTQPSGEGSETVVAGEAADKVPDMRMSSSTGSRRASMASRFCGSRPGSETGSRRGTEPTSEVEPLVSPRPPVRVHLRPHSRGLKVQLSLDGRRSTNETSEAEEMKRGIEEMRMALNAERERTKEAAEQLKVMAVRGSRPSTATPAIKLHINLLEGTSEEKLQMMEKALEAERAEFQRRLEEERAALATVLAEEKSKLEDHLKNQKKLFDEERQRLLRDLYEQQGRDIDQQLATSNQSIEALRQQRDALAGSGAAGSRNSSGRNTAAAEEAGRLEAAVKMLEKKLDDELSHVRQLEDEKARVEVERSALEAAQRMLEAQKSQAELEKAKAEQEKGALQEQIAKTMRMFQEQLAQTVKMAAMLQAQRILGAATGVGPAGASMMGLMQQGAAGTLGINPALMGAGGAPGPAPVVGGGGSPAGTLQGGRGLGSPATAGTLSGTLPVTPSLGSAAVTATANLLPQPVASLPNEVDDPPTQDEIIAYGKYLGMDVVEDADLLHIAEWALTAPLPEGWTVHLDGEGNEFFYNAANNASTYEHPMDEHYRAYYRKMKEQKQLAKMAEAQQAGAP